MDSHGRPENKTWTVSSHNFLNPLSSSVLQVTAVTAKISLECLRCLRNLRSLVVPLCRLRPLTKTNTTSPLRGRTSGPSSSVRHLFISTQSHCHVSEHSSNLFLFFFLFFLVLCRRAGQYVEHREDLLPAGEAAGDQEVLHDPEVGGGVHRQTPEETKKERERR